ncbi:hypothetical protein PHYSODRAFT_248209 [Phytophthora sojae]|uniref:Uncharacterized protein n=1 Tax=Phytophthora sojae (strain P6497) TaxID=1094619 RepID=G4YMJ4_PHYSP|nr:hypothetical protein PHYSODRAFT_248209 [Phytophthora sojae]EGZ28620.1 hypothetical protein PHYSODRAFT_248209 [Phytophthora sojae]|eukprot:XP_009515895.1 hypothetical protein PHYSODRAFT_248209 [Phytophthora sojae]
MPQIRGTAGSTISTPGLIIGCVLLALLILGFLQQQVQKRKRRTKYHPPLQLQQTSVGVLEQIGKRKEDLRRYIGKLREQLAAREEQLRYHDELEEIVTSRVETSRRDEEAALQEWSRLMKAGKKLHGDNWDASDGDEPSLRDLMELHKEELLEYKRSLHNQPGSSRQNGVRQPSTSRERKTARRPSKFNLPLLKLQPVAPLPSASHGIGATVKPDAPKFIPTQWQSTRAKAGSRLSAAIPTQLDAQAEDYDEPSPTQKMVVPPLDLSRLGLGPTIGAPIQDEPNEPAPKQQKRKSFEATFQRQTQLAAMLRKKK